MCVHCGTDDKSVPCRSCIYCSPPTEWGSWLNAMNKIADRREDMKDEKAVILRRIKKCHRRLKNRPDLFEQEKIRLERLKKRWREINES